jgi:glycosyltransferase involved in cell wall biosynthesis
VVPVRLHEGRFVALSAKLIDAIGRFFGDANESSAKEVQRLGKVAGRPSVQVSSDDIVLVTEVIIEPRRLAFFRQMREEELRRYRFIVHDLLPMTHPEYFWAGWLLEICSYYKILRRATCCGFNSEDTQEIFYSRVKRTNVREGRVLPLGCDALGKRAVHAVLNRPPSFTVLGTIEPRKNHPLILEAFEPLLKEITGLRLSFIGKMGWVAPEFAQKVQALSADKQSGFQFYSAAGDGAIRKCIEESRATIYVSAAEGYGLPPVESLWVGTPVIASTAIPSLKALGSRGVHFVDPLNVENLRHSVRAFLDDTYANQKMRETLTLKLPTWRSFTEEVLRWCAPEAAGV